MFNKVWLITTLFVCLPFVGLAQNCELLISGVVFDGDTREPIALPVLQLSH